MLNKIKKIFTLITWKRWFIIAFSFVCFSLFIGLSFGLKSKDNKVSQDYKNGISLVVKPYENDLPIEDSSYSRQLLFNLETRIKNNYPDFFVSSSFEENNVWNIDVTNIVNLDQVNSFKEFVLTKEDLTLTPINTTLNGTLYQNTTNNNSIFNFANKSCSNYELYMSNSNAFHTWAASYLNGISGDKKVIIWKNFDILKQIIEQYGDYTEDQTLYQYLYVNGVTPENYNESSSPNPVLFKEGWTFNGKKYKPTDFIVSKNLLSDFDNKNYITINKDFGVPTNQSLSAKEIDKEFYNLSYWVSNYSLNNSEFAPFVASNGNNSYTFLLVALISFFAIVSIFVVINYGYLGIFSIFILAMIVFLSLLMIGIFFGNYDSILIDSILLSSTIVLDFIVYFFERIKSEFFKGNSIAKSIKNSINKHKLSIFLKSLFLSLGMVVFYGVMSFVFGKFSIIALISCLAIPIFVVPCILGFSWIFSGLEKIGKSPKLIGLWNKKYLNLNYIDKDLSLTEQMNETIQDQIFVKNYDTKQMGISLSNPIKNYQSKQEKSFSLFKKHFEFKGLVTLLSIISCILIVGLISFLVGFFAKGKSLIGSFNVSAQDQNQIVLRIQKKQTTETSNDKFTNEEINTIKKTLVENFGFDASKIKVNENSLIEIKADKEFSTQKINEAILEINSLYDLVIIPSNLISSDTFKVMQYTLYSALLAIVAMSIFVLIWMKPAKAFVFMIVSLISIVLFVFMVGFGFVAVNSMLSVAATFAFIILSLSTINLLYNIHYKIKTIRTEEMTSDEIKEVVYKQTFKTLKPFIIINSITFLMFLLFTIMIGSLPTMFTLFMMLFVIVNSILVIVLVPKLVCIFEVLKSRFRRKIILENYWDTEKIKEQTFNGINNIK